MTDLVTFLMRGFGSPTEELWLQATLVALVVVMAASLAIVHVPLGRYARRLKVEVRSAGGGWVRRWLEPATPLLVAMVAAGAAGYLATPWSPPVGLVLHSRTRPGGAPTPELERTDAGIWLVDLGPSVDAVLRELDDQDAAAWRVGSPDEREKVTRALRQAIRGDIGVKLAAGARPSSREETNLPMWIIEAVEVSLARYAWRDRRAIEMRVAAGPMGSEEPTGWAAAAWLLTTPACPVTCVDLLDSGASGLSVSRIIAPTVDASTGVLHAWLRVDGRTQDGSHQAVAMRLAADGQKLVPFAVEIGVDVGVQRLVPLEQSFPGVRWDKEWHLEDGRGRYSVRIAKQDSPAPVGLIYNGPSFDRWAQAFAAVDAGRANTLKGFHEELIALGFPLPAFIVPEALAPSGVHVLALVERGHRLVVATDGAAAMAALDAGPSPESLPAAGRIVQATLGANTLYSPLQLWTPMGPFARAGNSIVTTSTLNAACNDGRPATQFSPGRDMVVVAASKTGCCVTLYLPPSPASWLGASQDQPVDPVAMLAVIRTLAWAADQVTKNTAGQSPNGGRTGPSWTAVPAPLLSETDFQAVRTGRAWTDLFVVFTAGGYVAWLGWRVRTGLPPRAEKSLGR